MIKQIYLILILVGFVFSSCDKSNIEYENNFKKSEKAWLSFKNESNNSYRYIVTGGSWVGVSWETTLNVKNGKVIQRHFKYTNIGDRIEAEIPAKDLEWTENEETLGSHVNTSAASILTLDEVYELAKSDLLKKRKTAEVYFEAKNNGMISQCGYVENGCQDDCFVGISISKIEALQ